MRRHRSGGLIEGQADVADCVEIDYESLASEHCSIDSGSISHSVISGDTVVANSRVSSSIISCNRITNSFVWASRLEGRVVARNSHLEKVTLTGSILCDEAQLLGPWTMEYLPVHSDYLRITGVWYQPPGFLDGNNYSIVEGGGDTLWVGCKRRSFDYWLSHYRFGARLGEDAERIKEFILLLQSLGQTDHVGQADPAILELAGK